MSEHADTKIDLLVTGAAELLTCAADAPDLVGRIGGGGLAIDAGQILAVGDVSGYAATRVIDASGAVVMPGFIDAHTHVVFGGSRVGEYAARTAGRNPPADAPRGILGTVAQTRTTPADELLSQASKRIQQMLEHGTTTLESKSGYGLDRATELRLLQTNRDLQKVLPIEVVSTYLGAHAFPPDTEPARYLEQIIELLPAVSQQHIAEFCDVYCDVGYFDLPQTRRILQAGLDAGLRPKLHLDAYHHTQAADLAIELGAVSVDHLNLTTPSELERLGAAGIIGVYLPCLDYATAHRAPLDPRTVLRAGMELALATDLCPGCWTISMQLAVAMACRTGGLSVEQALRAATLGSARALGRGDRVGSLAAGMQADVIILDVPSYEHIAYRIGSNSVRTVIKAGRVVTQRRAHDDAASADEQGRR